MPRSSEGVESVSSPFPFGETLSRLKSAIQAKGLHLFAEIDHAAGAREAGLSMPPATVLIFGHAKAGTPLMIASPLLALDLPLKALVSEDAEHHVRVSFSQPEYLAARHSIPPELVKNISGVEGLIGAALK